MTKEGVTFLNARYSIKHSEWLVCSVSSFHTLIISFENLCSCFITRRVHISAKKTVSVSPPTWNSCPIGRISMKFDM
jgi:hypothetical protein